MRSPSGKHEFRVIAGELKGRRITSPDLGVTRPPLTRLRKSIFDFLNPYLVDARYLDLFSGTGSYLFEAVSRGAAEAVGVEMEPQLALRINQQAAELGVGDRLICHTEDVFDALARLNREGRQFDIVMLAPPQYVGLVDRTLEALSVTSVVTPESMVLAQHASSETSKLHLPNFAVQQQRKYGNTTFSVLRLKLK